MQPYPVRVDHAIQRRLLLIATGIDRRGAESHVLALGRGFVQRGWRVGVAYWGGSGELAAEFQAAGVSVHRLEFRGELNPLSLVPFVQLIRRFTPDVVHTHLPLAEFYGNLAAALCRVPAIVSTKHSDHALFLRAPVRLGHILMSAPNGAVVAVSEHIARFVQRVGLWPGKRLQTIHNGLDLDAYDRTRDSADLIALRESLAPLGCRLIGAAGRLEPEKGFDVLIAAIPLLLERIPEARLVIAGGGSRRAPLQAQIERLGLVGRVRLLGARTDLVALMHTFDVFALSSRAEPFGLVLLEAMAACRPVVATNVGGVPEVVIPGQTAELVPPSDPAALAAVLGDVLVDTERASRYGDAGRRRVELAFPLEQMLDATEHLYRDMLSGSPPGAMRGVEC